MIFGGAPYYTRNFGSMEETLETARRTEFFLWFHMEESERRKEPPGEAARFRPTGGKFHDLCYLDLLMDARGKFVEMELALLRSFIDGRDGWFGQDLVKSFLHTALPDACRYQLNKFLKDMEVPGGKEETPGYAVFKGKRSNWTTQTAWSRMLLANLWVPEAPSFVVHLRGNPEAPNTKLAVAKEIVN